MNTSPPSPSFWTRRLSRREVWVYRGVYALPWIGTALGIVPALVAATVQHEVPVFFQGIVTIIGVIAGSLAAAGITGLIPYTILAAMIFFIIPQLSVKGNILLALLLPLFFVGGLYLLFNAFVPDDMKVGPSLMFLPLAVAYFYATLGAGIMVLYSRRQDRKTGHRISEAAA
ncbi:MAG: hypothetical protein M3O22_08780 [Pseudomonadota bacterium]|nr:hypothetical protein [Pseudomonadota bacterium]